jgi:hypothetical protein
MDTVILAASLVSFLALIASWIAMPSSGDTAPAPMPHGAPVRA